MIIAIKSCEAHRDREEVQRATWATSHTVWFTGPMLGVSDDYHSLPAKTRAICKALQGVDYAFLCDTDTYVALDRLLAYDPKGRHYLGHTNEGAMNYASGGVGYILSGHAMALLSTAPLPTNHDFEDRWVGEILDYHSIKVVDDQRFLTYTACLPGNDIISQHITGNHPYHPDLMLKAHEAYCAR
jgi:hypothetical protein